MHDVLKAPIPAHEKWAVPPFTVVEYAAKRSACCIVTTAWDEGERSLRQYREMLPHTAERDFVIVNRGSFLPSQGEAAHRALNINAILEVATPGQSPAYRAGLAWALQRGYEHIVIVDSNGKDGMAAMPRFFELLDQGYDLVQGSRFMPGGHHENTPFIRQLAIRAVIPGILWAGCGTWYSDQSVGFKGFSRRFLTDPRVQPFREIFTGYSILPYLNYAGPRHGFRVIQTPTSRCYPQDGTVPTKLQTKRQMLRLLFDYLRVAARRFDP
jgi:hypothetical protein